MENKNQKIWIVVALSTVLFLIIIFIGITYAFFTANNPEGSTAQIISDTGRMLITYDDGTDNIIPVTDIQPSNKILVNKTFTLTGSNTAVGMNSNDGLDMSYNVGVEYLSTFSDGMIHYYIKEVERPTDSNVTAEYTGETNKTVPGNDELTGYSHGTFKYGNRYTEMVSGEFPASLKDQTIKFNLIMQFPDNNKNQDSEKEKTFNGKIVINHKPTINEYVADLDLTKNGLDVDNTTDKNIRYIGTSPKNYIKFNDEIWRIIGVFNNITTIDDSGNKKTESLVKIIRNDSLGNYSWDATDNNNYGVNDWSEADLMKELNGDYLDTTLTANKANWYNSYWKNNVPVFRQNGVFDYTKVIKIKYQQMIRKSVWNLGGNEFSNSATLSSGFSTKGQYEAERGTVTYQSSRATTWTGKIGLMYTSDYGYASTDAECRTNLRAGVTYTNNSYDYTNTKCKNNNWLFNSDYQWTLSPRSSYASNVFVVMAVGCIGGYSAGNALSVRPALFLKSDVVKVGGTGTESDPYTIE